MSSIKILHCADIHIGAADAFLGSTADSRMFETLITFENIIDLAVQNEVQLLTIAGDLFDAPTPDAAFVNPVLSKIASAPHLKVVYCAGNHDPLIAQSPFVINTLPQNLFVLPTEDTCLVFDDIKSRVYGRSFDSAHLQGEEEFSLTVPQDDYINILVQHGELKSDLNSDYNAITPRFIRNSGMDYIALGHVHKHTPVGKLENVSFAYCGCPEGQGFDELDEKGVYMGTVGKGSTDLKFIPIARRKHIHEKIDITNIDDISSHILQTLKDRYQNFGDHLYKIELIGEIDPDSTINCAELSARLSTALYFVKIKDSTEYKIDFETLAKEASLKGVFVKIMLEKQENAEDKDAIKRALKIGLKAFGSEVKYNEN